MGDFEIPMTTCEPAEPITTHDAHVVTESRQKRHVHVNHSTFMVIQAISTYDVFQVQSKYIK